MLLAIDIGNTNIVFALFEGERQRAVWRAATDPRRTSDEYGVWLAHLMQLQGMTPADVTDAIVASVVPPATFNILRLCREFFHCLPIVVGDPEVDLGIGILVDSPGEVGADRLVNTVAAGADPGGPAIVIDFGTATTFDVVDRAGAFRGGVIAPGINLSLDALHRAAAKLPKVEIAQTQAVIGTNTVACMQSGVFWGYVSMIEGLVQRMKAEFGEPMKVIATGGLAVLFATATQAIDRIDSDLTLRGLRLIHARVRAARRAA